MSQSLEPENRYEGAKKDRQKYVDAVLNSAAKKKIVVAGPGTGKTHLYKRLLSGKKKTLTLTFVNSLVEDLSLELCGLSEVRTLHSFARSVLAQAGQDVKLFPKLSRVIGEDATVLLREDVDFDRLFHNREDEDARLEFYKQRKNYYRHCGYSDVVSAAVEYFMADKKRIPAYELLLVDEFQDFNKLEVSLIDLLAEKSPILVTGDDDQALYDFKSASTEHIRLRHGTPQSGYAVFSLPYCSRSTRVIVDCVNDVIRSAISNGHLKGRIDKAYQYFDDEKKDKESANNPKVIYSQIFPSQIAWFVQDRIAKVAEELKTKFSVLIISPTRLQSRSVAKALRSKGLQSIESAGRDDARSATLLDGLKILLNDKKSSLGWRIICKCILAPRDFESLLGRTHPECKNEIFDAIGVECKKKGHEMLKVLRAIRDEKEITQEELNKFLQQVLPDAYDLVKNTLKEGIDSRGQRLCHPAIRKILITATTVQSSKGLAADYVFITHFDDRYFIKNANKHAVSDQDICNFLVALTRARKKVFLISSDVSKKPTFLEWISRDRIEAN